MMTPKRLGPVGAKLSATSVLSGEISKSPAVAMRKMPPPAVVAEFSATVALEIRKRPPPEAIPPPLTAVLPETVVFSTTIVAPSAARPPPAAEAVFFETRLFSTEVRPFRPATW